MEHLIKYALILSLFVFISCNQRQAEETYEEEEKNSLLTDYVREPLREAEASKDAVEEREEILKKRLEGL